MKYKCLEKLKNNENSNKPKSRIMSFANKVLMAVFLGLITLIVMEYSPKFKTFMNDEVLNKNFSFGVFGKLYNKYFGKLLPNAQDNTVSVFNESLTYTSKSNYSNGYKLEVTPNYLVPVINDGVIVFIGEKEEYGSVIVVEQTDGVNITYGNINSNNVKLYDYITKGTFLGETIDNTLYLVLEKEGEYLDIETYLS